MPNPPNRADGNRKQRSFCALTAISAGRQRKSELMCQRPRTARLQILPEDCDGLVG